MKYVIILFGILLTFLLEGCSSVPVPVIPKFPEAPQALQEPCPELKSLSQDPKLSDVAKIITENYTLYHECALKVRTWTLWWSNQKSLFEGKK